MRLLLPLAAILLLASCSSRVGLMKRKYNKGFYVSVSHKHNTPQTVATAPKKHSNTPEATHPALHQEVARQAEMAAPPATPARIEANANTSAPAAKAALPQTLKAPKKQEIAYHAPDNAISQSVSFRALPQLSNSRSASKGGSDTDLIIQIILALFPFLCLIAVYLHDGKKITLNFWIDLLLHLTIFFEILFAILVVVDVINLAK